MPEESSESGEHKSVEHKPVTSKLRQHGKNITIGGGAVTVLVALVQVWFDTREASHKTETGYQTLAPAIAELQEVAKDATKWMDATNKALEILAKDMKELQYKSAKQEAMLEFLKDRSPGLRQVERETVPPPPEPVEVVVPPASNRRRVTKGAPESYGNL